MAVEGERKFRVGEVVKAKIRGILSEVNYDTKTATVLVHIHRDRYFCFFVDFKDVEPIEEEK